MESVPQGERRRPTLLSFTMSGNHPCLRLSHVTKEP